MDLSLGNIMDTIQRRPPVRSLLLIVYALSTGFSAPNSMNYNPYRYDMTIPLFSPDGRLLQVEYASAASDNSSPILSIRLNSDLTVVGCKRPRGSCVDRLVVLPFTAPNTFIALSGLLADNFAIVRKVQESLLSEYQRFDGKSSPTAQQLVRMISGVCQANTMAGGVRVYGSTAWVGGMVRGRWTMYRTDPSGSVQLVDDVDGATVLGGGDTGRALQRKCGKIVSAAARDMNIQQTIRDVIHALLKSDDKDEEGEVEMILVSESRGVLKLTPAQIQRYLEL